MPATNEITYNPNAGRYIYTDTKRFVPQAIIRNLVDTEQQQLGVRLQALTRLLANQTIALEDWQQRFAQILKDAHLRMATLAAGGKDGLTSQHYGAVGYQLQKQYDYLNRFANQISGGKVSLNQAMVRSRQYAASVRVTFGKSEQITRIGEEFTEAKRSLDPVSQHCVSCLRNSTRELWVPITQVIMPGVDCECGQFCRCHVVYRQRRVANLNQAGILRE